MEDGGDEMVGMMMRVMPSGSRRRAVYAPSLAAFHFRLDDSGGGGRKLQVEVRTRPLHGVHRCLQELLVRVLGADVLRHELVLHELLNKHLMPRHQVLLREPGVEHKRVILKREDSGR